MTGLARVDSSSEIFILDLASEKLIDRFGAGRRVRNLAWNTKRSWLAFSATFDGVTGSWLIDLETRVRYLLARGSGEALAWAPDGCRLGGVYRNTPTTDATSIRILDVCAVLE
jgi:hypothetical protein